MKEFARLWFPVIGYAVFIFWASSSERPFGIVIEAYHIDKLVHFVEYNILGFLLMRAITGSDPKMTYMASLLLVFAIGAFYGLTDELHQSVVPGRFAAFSDFIFDSLGSLAGAATFNAAYRKNKS